MNKQQKKTPALQKKPGKEQLKAPAPAPARPTKLINPANEGVDHIRLFPKSKSPIGRFFFQRAPIELTIGDITFKTAEAAIYHFIMARSEAGIADTDDRDIIELSNIVSADYRFVGHTVKQLDTYWKRAYDDVCGARSVLTEREHRMMVDELVSAYIDYLNEHAKDGKVKDLLKAIIGEDGALKIATYYTLRQDGGAPDKVVFSYGQRVLVEVIEQIMHRVDLMVWSICSKKGRMSALESKLIDLMKGTPLYALVENIVLEESAPKEEASERAEIPQAEQAAPVDVEQATSAEGISIPAEANAEVLQDFKNAEAEAINQPVAEKLGRGAGTDTIPFDEPPFQGNPSECCEERCEGCCDDKIDDTIDESASGQPADL